MFSTHQAPSSVLRDENNKTAVSGVSLRLRALWPPALTHVEKPSLPLSRASSSLWSRSGIQFQSKKDECPLARDLLALTGASCWGQKELFPAPALPLASYPCLPSQAFWSVSTFPREIWPQGGKQHLATTAQQPRETELW